MSRYNKQERRSMVVLAAATAIVLALFLFWLRTAERVDPCPTEDMILVEMVEDNFDWEGGDRFCVHIDDLYEP